MTMMNLYVDAGNQFVKWLYGNQQGKFPSQSENLRQHINEHWSSLSSVHTVYVANVAGDEVMHSIAQWATAQNATSTFISPKKKLCGVEISYVNVNELGADRFAAILGAWSLVQNAVIVVDCGTAVTVDAIDSTGVFVGGSILPGFHLSQSLLWERASGISEHHKPEPVLPSRSTREAVSSGALYSMVGGVDRLIDEYSCLLDAQLTLLLAGGDAALLAKHSRHKFINEPNIVFTGLEVIAKSE